MATANQTVQITADLTMHVPRNATGDLGDGVTNVVRGVSAVASVDGIDVQDLRPRLNDLQVTATVTAVVTVADAPDIERATADALADGFGIDSVADVDATRVAADHDDRAPEYA
ncbi:MULTISPECIES: hypothetical protein [Halobacterium]|nr:MULTISPECIES: hypothetical protein [Halobacterium]AAG19660.1 hypothetical protein VNG_1318H [Halobacterium salinarum NRC-1]MBB6090350.1 hypothetical protein [Halobacterium salinarum]MCF2165168.1 hypothetical protein [Halobacterium salinarum]MCF2168023.1 hypothetical protein [Halobacterium salinarum]MCF2238655.1 hypothetical protein [Halobacterium salinarum]